jgi:hypothetical protein
MHPTRTSPKEASVLLDKDLLVFVHAPGAFTQAKKERSMRN